MLCDCISGFSLRNGLTEVVRHPHPDAFFSYLLKINFSFHKGLHFFCDICGGGPPLPLKPVFTFLYITFVIVPFSPLSIAHAQVVAGFHPE